MSVNTVGRIGESRSAPLSRTATVPAQRVVHHKSNEKKKQKSKIISW